MGDRQKINWLAFIGYVKTSCVHTLVMTVRRYRSVMVAVLALLPVLIPLALALLSDNRSGHDGLKVFSQMVRYMYIDVIVPVLSLFFACMVIGEDVESETISYLMTRPIPRSALVLGKYGAFLIISVSIIVSSTALTFAASTALSGLSFSGNHLTLLLEYIGVELLALIGYGAFCMLLGAMLKRPVVVGIAIIFGWQRVATIVPGLIDFFTIKKYVYLLLNKVGGSQIAITVKNTALADFQKKEVLITATKSGMTLLLIAFVFLAVTTFVVRRREYTSARALGG